MLRNEDTTQIRQIIDAAEHVHCICHRNPDGDAIGSLVGIALLIEKQYPQKRVSLYCHDPVPETFHFLQATSRVTLDPQPAKGDCIIFVDSAEPKLTEMHESHPQLFDKSFPSINIDHHPTNSQYATVNVIEPDASSACEIILDLAQALQWEIDADIATGLLTGVYTDTGGLLHSNTTGTVYKAVAQLLRLGARQQEIVTAVFRTAKLSTLKLWGRVLEHITITEEGGAISAVTEGDFRATNADASELTGAIDYLNAVPGMRFSLILSEREGKVKGSLRTLRDDVDVAEMASKFSGGGHRKAAGFAVPGKLQPEVRWKVVDESGERRS